MADMELTFSGAFDPQILSGTIDGGNPEFQSMVESKVNDCLLVLRLQPGVNSMATFVDFNGLNYKLNVKEL